MLDGSKILPELAEAVSQKFRDRIAAVRKLKRAIETSYASPAPPSRTPCCQLSSSELEYDSRFRTNADTKLVCTRTSKEATSFVRNLGDNVFEAMVKNLEDQPLLKWQYFGSEKGLTTQFPASKSADCSTYDSRFRPWYVETATPVPKHVVIVIDKSGSMRDNNRMSLAKDAAKTVLSTMNPRDEVKGFLFIFIFFYNYCTVTTESEI